MVTPKLGMESILCLHIYYTQPRPLNSERDPLRVQRGFKHEMDATLNFEVTMISEVPSNRQLTFIVQKLNIFQMFYIYHYRKP